MKKVISSIALLSLIALGATLFLTRPDDDDYALYLAEQMADNVEASVCQPDEFSKWLGKVGEALSRACEGLVAGGESLTKEEIQQLIIDNTNYQNRVLFSTYMTETPFGNYRAFGVLNRFIIKEQAAKQ
ncbi:MAG: DUF4359 domain-containing protein [Cyanobacteria bacterium P01_D01_bin.105]